MLNVPVFSGVEEHVDTAVLMSVITVCERLCSVRICCSLVQTNVCGHPWCVHIYAHICAYASVLVCVCVCVCRGG